MGEKGGGTNTTTTTQNIPPEVLAQYQKVTAQANDVASQPLQQYQGNIVAGLSGLQNQGLDTLGGLNNTVQPYINQGQQYLANSTTPLWNQTQQFSPQSVQQYQNPYTQNVINATEAQQNQQDAIQQSQVVGNAASQGAWGGDRSAVAQALTAGQQALANNSTIAGLENQGYSQALGEFNQQQGAQLGAAQNTAALNAQGAYTAANLGNTALGSQLQTANAQLQGGGLQQQVNQAQLNVPYEQFLQRQAFPYQNTSWLSGISTGLGSQEGGTSSTTSPQPTSLLGSIFQRGGVVGYADGGDVDEQNVSDSIDNSSFGDNSHPPFSQDAVKNAIASVESNNGQNINNPDTNAFGTYQVMPSTAANPGYGIEPARDHSQSEFDRVGSDLIDMNYNRYNGDPTLIALAHHNGTGAADYYQRTGQMPANAGNATQDYVNKVQSALGIQPDTTAPDITDSTNVGVTPDVKGVDDNAATNTGLGSNTNNKPADAPPEKATVNPWISAGLGLVGLLAGKGYNAGDRLSSGLLQGATLAANNYEKQSEDANKENYQNATVEQAKDKLSQEVEAKRKELAITQQNANTNESYKNAVIAAKNAPQAPDPTKYEIKQDPVTGETFAINPLNPNDVKAVNNPSNVATTAKLKDLSDNTGVALQPAIKGADIKDSVDAQNKALNSVGQISASINSLNRVKEILNSPNLNRGLLAQAERKYEELTGSGVAPDVARAQSGGVLPANSNERALYEELAKLEGNQALQNEVTNGIGSRALGFNMVKLGQKLFASPEMDPVAQLNIVNTALKTATLAANANRIVSNAENASTGSLNRLKSDYYDKSDRFGTPIPVEDYISGKAKQSDYKPQSTTSANSAPAAGNSTAIKPPDLDKRVKGQQYDTNMGKMVWTGTGWVKP
jgi:hypothetical protein